MRKNLVSVVIPTYNREKTLGAAINSVLSQTYTNWEIIIVDDASVDGTDKLVESYSDSRIQYLCHSTNMGGGIARNTGIEKASGEYVAFLDSDDVWLPEKLELQVMKLDSLDESWGAVYSGLINVLENRRTIVNPTLEGNLAVGMLSGKYFLPSSVLLLRKNCFEQIGKFNPTLSRFQDLELMLRFFSKFKIAVEPRELAIINRYYKTDFFNIERDGLVLIDQINRFLMKVPRKELRRVLSFRYLQLAKNMMQGCGTVFGAIRYFVKAFVSYPIIPAREYASFMAALIFRATGKDIRILVNRMPRVG